MKPEPGTGGSGPVGGGDKAAARIPLSLYVHIPWCVRKCPYCDFNSHVPRESVDQQAYVDALLVDLEHELARQPLPAASSVFIGGGTPSLFGGAAIARLLDGIDSHLGLGRDAEITLEANPGTAEAGRFAAYRAAGVSRLSIGVQSLDDGKLAALGRIHSAGEARAAVAMARSAGFDNVNLDLMYGLPGQTLLQALDDLGALLELEPEHVSWYQLTLEPNTRFAQQPPEGLPDGDALADIMDAGLTLLAGQGYRQYEVSAHARDGRQCRHNLNYWAFGDYVGIGAGAHGKLTRTDGRVERTAKRRAPASYLRHVGDGAVSTRQAVPPAQLPLEFMLNALRLNDGVPAATFEWRTGLSLADLEVPLARARERGLMVADVARLQPTGLGQRFLNDLLALFGSG